MGALSMKEKIAQKRGAIAADQSKGTRTYKWKPGKTTFRIIPAKDGGDWDRKFGKTWLKSFDGQQKFSIGDRDITYDEQDPIKDMIFQAMRAAPTPEMKDHYKEMLASTKHIFQVLIISVNGAPDPDAPPTEPQIVEVSQTQMDNIFAQFEQYLDMDPDYDLAGKESGHLFTCEKKGTGFDTTYTFLATPQKAPLKDEIIQKQHDLDAWIKGEFDGLEAKAIEFLGRLNGAAGITVAVNAGLLRDNGGNAGSLTADPAAVAAASTAAAANAAAATTTPADNGMSDDAVTTVIEDADFEEVAAEESPFATEPEVTPEPTPAAEPAAAATPAAAEPAATPAAAAVQSNEIDDILAGLQ